MPTIVHFEIPAEDVERAKSFYSTLFSWDIKQVPGMDYWIIDTCGEKAVNGGMMKKQNPQQTVTNYVDVPSVEKYSKIVEKLGGKVIQPKMAVPQMGYFAVCLDTEGNAFGLWESNKDAA